MSRCVVRRRSLLAIAGCLPAIALLAISMSVAQGPLASTDRPLVTPCLNMPPTLPLQPGQWHTVPAFPHLRFLMPTCLVQAPRSDRFYVCERDGGIKSFTNDSSATEATVVLDLTGQCQGVSDCGLMGLAFHPDFGKPSSPNRGYLYVFYNYSDKPVRLPERPDSNMKTWDRLSRFTIPDGSLTADPKSELVLIDQEDSQLFHTGGAMFFHPDDGFLYLTVGDEGGAGGRLGNCQLIDKDLYSGVLRIDVDCDPARSHPPKRQPKRGKTAHYFIPNDNPFVGMPNVLEEFWAIGFRSPHRMTLDPVSKRIWLGDVGDGGTEPREEVNLIEKGGNYQWNYREGTVDRGFAPKPTRIIGVEKPPFYEYPHTEGNCCVIGGYVYRGREHAELLDGKYIFGDWGSGRIWALSHRDGKPPTIEELCVLPANARRLSSFGVDQAGELYLCEIIGGQIHKLVRYGTAAAPLRTQAPLPGLLSQTGAFRDAAKLVVADGVIPYEVNAPLFSDNTVKRRWIAVPNSGAGEAEKIIFSPTGEWTFPAGTVFVKHFDLPIDESNPQALTRLETRFVVRDPIGSVYGVTYKWRPDQREADVLDGAATDNLAIVAAKPVEPLTGAMIGAPTRSGAITPTKDGYEITPAVAPEPRFGEHAHFARQQRSGDFDVRVHLTAPAHTEGGLLARAPDGRQVGIVLAPDASAAMIKAEFRQKNSAHGSVQVHTVENGHTTGWLRLQRTGSEFTAFTSPDGIRWSPAGSAEIALPEVVQLGVAATASEPGGVVVVKHFANVREQRWTYPSRNDCLTCHNANAKFVLGVNARQLNGDAALPCFMSAAANTSPQARDNQLRTWSRLGLFNRALTDAEIAACPKLVDVSDTTAALVHRVRSYLDANCAYCHRPNGAQGYFDARFDTQLDRQGILYGAVINDLGVADARVILPRDDGKSLLYERMKRCDNLKMPPLGRSIRDVAALKTVREWISYMPPKRQLSKRLTALSVSFVAALILGYFTRRRLCSRVGGDTWRVRIAPALTGVAMLAACFLVCLIRLEKTRDLITLAGVTGAAAAVLVMCLCRRFGDGLVGAQHVSNDQHRANESSPEGLRRAA